MKINFDPVKNGRISEAIINSIKEKIIKKKLITGDRLPQEKVMAKQFGVSLVTIREALRVLEIEGLIERKRGNGGGIFITTINNDFIKTSLGNFLTLKHLSPEHLYEVRKIIEPLAIILTAKRINTDEIKKLEENVSYCEQLLNKILMSCNPITSEEFFNLDNRNNEFHRLIAKASHNPILELTVEFVLEFLSECETKKLELDIDYCINNINDHRDILEYLKQRDGENSNKKMYLHLKRLEEYVSRFKGTSNNLDFEPQPHDFVKVLQNY